MKNRAVTVLQILWHMPFQSTHPGHVGAVSYVLLATSLYILLRVTPARTWAVGTNCEVWTYVISILTLKMSPAIDMDDESNCGRQAYALTFSETNW
jgi:hypothetical protein